MVAAEIGAGQARLKALFGPRALPVLVPPWNRFADEFLPLLSATGIVGLSAMVSPGRAASPPSVAAIDVHVDLVAWRRDRGFVGAGAALGGLVYHLRQARLGAVDASKPIGVLTHHLIMDEATAAFLDRLTGFVQAHHAARWSTPGEFLS
jgi:hypothetical protein